MKNSVLKYIGVGFLTLGYVVLSLIGCLFVYWTILRVLGLTNYSVASAIGFCIAAIGYVYLLVLLQGLLIKRVEKPKTIVTISCLIPIIYFVAEYIKTLLKPANCDGLDLLSDNWSYVFCKIGDELNRRMSLYFIGILIFTIIVFIIIDIVKKRKRVK